MTATAALARAHAAGLTVTAEGDRLRWRGPPPPADVLAELRANKAELLDLLTAANDAGPPPDDAPMPPDRHAAILAGHLRAALQRPPSWPDPAAPPPPGAWCSCCRGSRWWREREAPTGWRCWRCHPPDHLAQSDRVEVRTDNAPGS